MRFAHRVRAALKAFVTGQQFWGWGPPFSQLNTLPRTGYDYARDVKSGLDSNVIMSVVQWIMRTFTEAEPVVERRVDGNWEQVEDHPAEQRIDRPNDFYDGDTLIKATLVDYVLQGEAFWIKERSKRFGNVVNLWWIPHRFMEPIAPADGSAFISHYEYTPAGQRFIIPIDDVVHIRFGLDPRDPKRGISPLRPLMREIFTDDEAANYSAKILQNMGVPGMIVSPKDAASRPAADDVKELKDYIQAQFTGDKRGGALVLSRPTDLNQFGFNPQALELGNLRDIAEERVCAALGIPAAVVGFGSGLQSTKVGATMRELRRLAWVQALIPMQKSIAKQLTMQLLPDYVAQLRRFRIRFNTETVSAFNEEETEKARRVAQLVQAGILRVDRAQELLGLEVDPSQDIYLRPSNSEAFDADGNPVEQPEPLALPEPSPNGGGIDDLVLERMNGNGA